MNDEKREARILMVDDEEDFLAATAMALKRRGFEVETASDGLTALDMLRELPIDAAVVDLKMPGMDGAELFRRMREMRPELPVLMLTGHGSVTHAFEIAREGIADYMAKPVDIDELADRLHDVLQPSGDVDEAIAGADTGTIIRVLMVDDEIDYLDALAQVLARRGMTVTTADSGPRALEILGESFIDVVILDVKMPGMDGLEVLRRIKRDFATVQVILLSGHPSVAAAMEGVQSGAAEYLTKPPEIDDLVGAIGNVYRRRLEGIEKQRQDLIDEILRRYPD